MSEPESGGWHRFRPQASFGDPFLEPGRLAILLDVYSYPAVVPRHPGTRGGWTAPNIDLHVLFTHIPAGDEWLLAMGRAPASADGLVGFHSDVWNESGLKLASATGQMVWRQTRPSP